MNWSGSYIQPEKIQQQGWRHHQQQQAHDGADTVKQVITHLDTTPFPGGTNYLLCRSSVVYSEFTLLQQRFKNVTLQSATCRTLTTCRVSHPLECEETVKPTPCIAHVHLAVLLRRYTQTACLRADTDWITNCLFPNATSG